MQDLVGFRPLQNRFSESDYLIILNTWLTALHLELGTYSPQSHLEQAPLSIPCLSLPILIGQFVL